ncbi:MAG TPA: hypothetical protein QF353_06355 [Gammaproteobacteria bacterium]|nr:hypothetical protein [Gammaproteobacteria bacterium]
MQKKLVMLTLLLCANSHSMTIKNDTSQNVQFTLYGCSYDSDYCDFNAEKNLSASSQGSLTSSGSDFYAIVAEVKTSRFVEYPIHLKPACSATVSKVGGDFRMNVSNCN